MDKKIAEVIKNADIKDWKTISIEFGEEFFDIAPKVPVRTEVTEYSLSEANNALNAIREVRINGAAVLVL